MQIYEMTTTQFYIDLAEKATAYLQRKKTHTAAIITQSIVSDLISNKNIQYSLNESSGEERKNMLVLLQKAAQLVQMNCRTENDNLKLKESKEALQKLFNDHELVISVDEETSDDTECSCDDCHNHTCSTFGSLDGCRRDRSRY